MSVVMSASCCCTFGSRGRAPPAAGAATDGGGAEAAGYPAMKALARPLAPVGSAPKGACAGGYVGCPAGGTENGNACMPIG